MKRCYFLDARELATAVMQEKEIEQIYAKLDTDRIKKLSQMSKKQGTVWAERLGAGLLLQYAVQEYLSGADSEGLQIVALTQVLGDKRKAVPLSLKIGEQGKPYLQNIPLYYSLSHSEGRVICAVSESEVGADLQYPRGMERTRIVTRFFSEEEKLEWNGLPLEKQEEFFYRLWTRKEAYGKFTGEGVGKTVSQSMNHVQSGSTVNGLKDQGTVWEEYVHDGAYIAVCYGNK